MKGISKVVWVVMAFLLAVAVAFGLGYWYFVMLGKTGGMMNKQECDLTIMTSCSDYQGRGYPSTMHVKVRCDENEEPAVCGCAGYPNQWHEADLSVSAREWWDCIAPGCYAQFGIEIDSPEDCGGHPS